MNEDDHLKVGLPCVSNMFEGVAPWLVLLKPKPTLHLHFCSHVTMPHLDLTYHTQTKRLDLKPTWIIFDNKIHQCGNQRRPRRSPTPWKYMTRQLAAPLHPNRRRSKDEMKLINAIHLEPGRSQGTSSKWSLRDIAKRAKTDWSGKKKLVAEFREDLRKLTKPTRRVLLPPPGLEYEEVIRQIMFQDKEGWKTRPDPPLPILLTHLIRSRL